MADNLFGRLQARRPQPLAHLRPCFRLARLAQHLVARGAGRKRARLLAQSLRLGGEPRLQSLYMLEPMSRRHQAFSLVHEVERAVAF